MAIAALVAVVMVLSSSAAVRSQQTAAEELALQRFHQAVGEYVSLHRRLEESLPPLRPTSDSREIRQAVERMATAVRSARGAARAGDIFSPEIERLLRLEIVQTLVERGDDVAALLEDIDAEAPLDAVPPFVNGPIPWASGAMMPPVVLNAMPPLPAELQYRLAGHDLLLVDLHAELVIDILPRALPAGLKAGPNSLRATVLRQVAPFL